MEREPPTVLLYRDGSFYSSRFFTVFAEDLIQAALDPLLGIFACFLIDEYGVEITFDNLHIPYAHLSCGHCVPSDFVHAVLLTQGVLSLICYTLIFFSHFSQDDQAGADGHSVKPAAIVARPA